MIKTNRIFGLDLLRALAISLVLLSHCTFLLFPQSDTLLLNSIRAMGAIGVDLFFVLSGYLIGGILLKVINNEQNLKWSRLFKFWKRPWLRTLPNYFLILVLNVVVALIIGLPLPENTILYGFFLQNFSWGHPDFFTEAWSLSIEEFAYIVLPFALFLASISFKKKSGKKVFFITTIGVIALLTIFKIQYLLHTEITDYHQWSSSFRKVVIYRMDSIYYGFLAVYCVKSFSNFIRNHKYRLFVVGLLVFLVLHACMYGFALVPETHLWFYTLIYLQVIGVSLLLLFPYIIALKGTAGLNPVIEFISTRSYALYLVNYSLILLHMQQWIATEGWGLWLKIGMVTLFMLMTFTVSNAVYLYFEKPILRYRDQKFPR
ncbi:acyltransferase family protein [Aestuariivivens sediminis]|uniref:acyltransferase family protein n=1 Tax=Aestuariivivens sediminis TaxID=2913557 RepID=UPI001F562F66|nr:acyltransferase [Aestuariivivens sediminis]